jgi:hypothetical protein
MPMHGVHLLSCSFTTATHGPALPQLLPLRSSCPLAALPGSASSATHHATVSIKTCITSLVLGYHFLNHLLCCLQLGVGQPALSIALKREDDGKTSLTSMIVPKDQGQALFPGGRNGAIIPIRCNCTLHGSYCTAVSGEGLLFSGVISTSSTKDGPKDFLNVPRLNLWHKQLAAARAAADPTSASAAEQAETSAGAMQQQKRSRLLPDEDISVRRSKYITLNVPSTVAVGSPLPDGAALTVREDRNHSSSLVTSRASAHVHNWVEQAAQCHLQYDVTRCYL